MKKRKLGNTDIHLSTIGFGGAPIGNLFEKLDEATCYKTLERCNDSNINLYDTSPYYGNGLSEHRLGHFLKTLKSDSYYLSTKVGRYLTPEKEENINRGKWAGGLNFSTNVDYSYDGVMRSFEQSLHRLSTSIIDICLIHDVDTYTYGDQVDHYFEIAMKGAYKAITKLKEEKVIKAIGVGVNNFGLKINPPYPYGNHIKRGSYDDKGGLVETIYLMIAAETGWINLGIFILMLLFFYFKNVINYFTHKKSDYRFMTIGIAGALTSVYLESALEWVLKQTNNFYQLMLIFAIISVMGKLHKMELKDIKMKRLLKLKSLSEASSGREC